MNKILSSRTVFHTLCGLTALSILSAALPGCTRDNTPPAPPITGTPAAVSTGGSASIQFAEAAESAGVRYAWKAPGKTPHTILDTIGNGCAFLDYDNDGNLDILLVGPKPALFRGDGKGHFTDVTASVGLGSLASHFLGCAVGDYDNDGYSDIYISAYQGGVLLHNQSGKGFADVTGQAGLASQPWGTSCAFADMDSDGRLDLLICNYAIFTPQTKPQLCSAGNIQFACGPRFYQAEKNAFYRNLGGGGFQNAMAAWNVGSTQGKGLGIAIADHDGSGHQSVAIANDEMPGDMLQNKGGKFQNVATTAGVAYDSAGQVHGGMGIDWGDYDNDGKLDLFVATFENEPKSVYHNEGGGYFVDNSEPLGIGGKTHPYIAFGVKFFDANNDGWLDLLIANGHIQDNVALTDAGASYSQPLQLFQNQDGKSFEEITAKAGTGLQHSIVGRGLAVGDYDNDGKIDALVVDAEGRPLLLHNEAANAGHWLGCRLVGAKSNRDGYGALVTLKAGMQTRLRRCGTDGSYMSASDPRVHFGLGGSAAVESLTVRWPDGHTDTYANPPADRYITLREGTTTIQ